METYTPISFINDFIFCPQSIYFHQLYGGISKTVYEDKPQIEGTAAHQAIDQQRYSNRTDVLMNYEVYSNTYQLLGKIDTYDCKTKTLVERKKNIRTVYDGYVFQVYAQYFGLTEMGFEVKKIKLYDLTHNKNYFIQLPTEDPAMLAKFETTLAAMQHFDMNDPSFIANKQKCQRCIYNNLCHHSLC